MELCVGSRDLVVWSANVGAKVGGNVDEDGVEDDLSL